MVANSDGSERRQLTPSRGEQPLAQFATDPSWSPDGRRLVFTRSIDPFGPDLAVMNADGTRQRRLRATPKIDESEPDWSPDGRRLLFTQQRANGTGKPAVAVMKLDGSAHRRLADGRQPSWSPDGRRIAYVADTAGASRIAVMRADGTRRKWLTRPVSPRLPFGPNELVRRSAVGAGRTSALSSR